jgi:hypothetical protein
MFTQARTDLRELVELTEKIASFDATLAANRAITPESTAVDRRRAWEARKIELMHKYELL